MQNYWNLYLACKQQQLYGPVNYRHFRETGPRFFLWAFAVLQTLHDNKCHMHFSLFFFIRWNKILVWIVFVVMGAIRDLVKTTYTLKIKKICFSPIVSIQPCRPKSDSSLPWAQFRPKNSIRRLLQPPLGPISALETKSALANWTVFYSPKQPQFFLAKTNLCHAQCR